MSIDVTRAEQIVRIAADAFSGGDAALAAALDGIDAPIYVTDTAGTIIYHNAACIPFAGRTPEIRRDNWCVTWRLYSTDGTPMPHDRCPMAVAIQERRSVRGSEAVAERPDGSRVAFIPYPTPLFDPNGELAGAVNLLVDVTQQRQADHLRAQALRCRRLAADSNDPRTISTLKLMADDYAEQAKATTRPS
jgi:PAS domain-containing protein